MRPFQLILICGLLLFLCGCGSNTPTPSAPQITPTETPSFSVDGALLVCDGNDRHLRDCTHTAADLSQLSEGEYYSFALIITNHSTVPLTVSDPYVVVDGGERWGWQDFTLEGGRSVTLQIYRDNMSSVMTCGTHNAVWYLSGQAIHTEVFTFTDSAAVTGFWAKRFPLPAQGEIQAANRTARNRSPYLAGWLDIATTDRFTEYAIDFKADYLPEGTYCCVAQWRMDISSLKAQYHNVHTEYEQVHAYAGFQNTENGKMSIMSFWDIYGTDANGQQHTFRAKLVYPEETANNSFGGEGTGAHHMTPYHWQAGKWYRMLLQCSTDPATGHTLVEQWVCDLETMQWTRLCCYDTGLTDSCFMGPVAVFLENYDTDFAGEVRSLELRNVRLRDASTGQWRTVTGSYLDSQDGAYEGSYAFGTEDDCFWMITSGVGRGGKEQTGGNYTVSKSEKGSPY